MTGSAPFKGYLPGSQCPPWRWSCQLERLHLWSGPANRSFQHPNLPRASPKDTKETTSLKYPNCVVLYLSRRALDLQGVDWALNFPFLWDAKMEWHPLRVVKWKKIYIYRTDGRQLHSVDCKLVQRLSNPKHVCLASYKMARFSHRFDFFFFNFQRVHGV